jgi:hypothetical protein
MPRKWIAKRIAELDPATDYDEIWKLSSCYRPNDFMMNLVYAVTFPHFIIRRSGSRPVHRDGKGKVYTAPDTRADNTSWKMQHWWHHGSSAPETRKNIEALNRLHAYYAKNYPDSGFADDNEYMYTLCYEAAGLHRMMRRVGLPGISENEQLAAVEYWKRVTPLFTNVVTGQSIGNYPETFDGVMEWMDRWEADAAANAPRNDEGRAVTDAIIGQFANKYFPKPLHGVVRAWILSLYPDHLIRIYGYERPHPLAVRALRLMTAAIFALGEKVAPDPTDTFTERRQARKAAERAALKAASGTAAEDPDEEALQYAQRASSAQGGARCPYAAQGDRRRAEAEPLATS